MRTLIWYPNHDSKPIAVWWIDEGKLKENHVEDSQFRLSSVTLHQKLPAVPWESYFDYLEGMGPQVGEYHGYESADPGKLLKELRAA